MAAKKKRQKDTPEKQHARFVKAALDAEADLKPDALDKALKKMVMRNRPKASDSRN